MSESIPGSATAAPARQFAIPPWWTSSVPATHGVVVRAVVGPALVIGVLAVHGIWTGWPRVIEGLAVVPGLVATVLAYIWVCTWLIEAVGTAQRLSPLLRTVQPWHVWVFWILPVAGLFLPYVLVRDTVRSTVPGRAARVLVWVWWLAFVLGMGPGVVVPRLPARMSVMALVIAFVAWWRIVVVVQRSQEAAFRTLPTTR